MRAAELIGELSKKGVQLQAEEGELVVRTARGVLTPELKRLLAENKSELLTLLRHNGREESGRVFGCLRPDFEHRYTPFPLTDIQQAYWVGRTETLQLGKVGCHFYQEFESSRLELGRLEDSFQRLIRRHDMLRAVVDPAGRQRILEGVPPYSFQVVDLRGADAETVAAKIQSTRDCMSHQVFDPSQWPLFDVRTTLLGEGHIRTHLSFDLLMLDAVSLSLLIRDWERLYLDREFLDPLEISFRDYVLAEQAGRESADYRRAIAYWDQRTTTLPPAPELPPGKASLETGGQRVRRERRKGCLDAAQWSRLKETGTSMGLTPSMLLAAAFAEILATWQANSRFTLNMTFCRRPPWHPQIAKILGDFTTTVLLEVNHRGKTFGERAGCLQAQFMADMENAAVSGVEVLRRVRRARPELASAAMPVVFTSLLGHGEGGGAVLFSSNWLGDVVYGVSQTPQVSLDHQAFEEDGALVSQWDSLVDVYPEGVLDLMFSRYQDFLRKLAEEDNSWRDPDLSLLPQDCLERAMAVNATETAFPEGLLHTLFKERAALQPALPAVIAQGQTLTYEELNRQSLNLSYYLRLLGASPNRLVAVVMEKGWEQVVAVLGVLRAGAAFLPVDANLPASRIQQLLADGEVQIVLTQSWLESKIPWPLDVQRIPVDKPATQEDRPEPPPIVGQSSRDLAYTIYTSGSTGKPKGVMISHEGAVNTIQDMNRRFRVGPQDRVLALASLSFDLSVYDIFGLLAAGGAIVIPPPDSGRDPQQWAECIRRHRVTLWNSVPAQMKMLADFAENRAEMGLDSLRLVLLSGDWIPVTLPDRIKLLAPGAEVHSLGGATEASIWSITYPIRRVEPSWTSIPYGKPMANQTVHVLNERLETCPDGVCGNLYIGGKGLALGYWKNPQESSGRFIHHPKTGERLYRAGDLGRRQPDGNIELIGREDFQVKVQGYRIELGEIESVLLQHPQVRDGVVTACKNPQGQLELVGYVVIRPAETGGSAHDDRQIQQTLNCFLSERLPGYMVPSMFVLLEALPVTPNGKIDRGRLPLPRRGHSDSSFSEKRQGNSLEQLVVQIVESVLETKGVALRDRFLDLGCNSIHIVQIHRELRRTLDCPISIAEIFNHDTLGSLAKFLASKQKLSTPDVRIGSHPLQQQRVEVAQRRMQSRK